MDTQVKANKLDALTGLRAIAALAVFAQHFMGKFDCRVISGPIGGVAVSFFFVLSGFILVYVYKDRLSLTTTRKFYFTRFARIWPLHAVCLLLIATMLTTYFPPTDFPWVRAFSHWTLLQSWYPTSHWLGGYNQVSWTISAEAFFYLLFPCLLLGTTRQFWTKYVCLLFATIGSLSLMAYMLDGNTFTKEVAGSVIDSGRMVYFFPPFRVLEFATGMAAGMLFLKRSENRLTAATSEDTRNKSTLSATAIEILVLGLSICCFHIFAATGLLRFIYSIPEIGPTLKHWTSFAGGMYFHAITVYVFAKSSGWVSRFMASRTMVFFGEISFAFYMIHYCLTDYIKQEFWIGSNFSVLYFAVLTLALSTAVSAWLYYLVEVPAKRTLLRWYDRDATPGQLLYEMLVKPIQRMTQSSMLPAMLLAIIVPIVITKVYKRIDRKSFTATHVMQSAPTDFQTVKFGEKVELLAADVVFRRRAARVSAVLKFTSPGQVFVNVHFGGTNHESRKQTVTCRPEEVGQPIVMNMVVHQGKYEEADRIELSLNYDGQHMAPDSSNPQLSNDKTNRYAIFSRDQLQQGLRVSRLPVLTR